MPRAIINISLPEPTRDYVMKEVRECGYGSVSEFFRELVREHRQKRLNERNREYAIERYKIEKERLELIGFHRPGDQCSFHHLRRKGVRR